MHVFVLIKKLQCRICLSLKLCAGNKHPSGLLAGHIEVLVNGKADRGVVPLAVGAEGFEHRVGHARLETLDDKAAGGGAVVKVAADTDIQAVYPVRPVFALQRHDALFVGGHCGGGAADRSGGSAYGGNGCGRGNRAKRCQYGTDYFYFNGILFHGEVSLVV